ncbi:conserved hypothetical protein [Paenibacillus curdlanolyticus YK9]|uniref:Uncharacterized protein n=1 Tax=Paenibacillus curdlanolyticus YK9 TaxID=717606 RepID=E0I3K8_9BACL|nr:hypothetical protein [Paenibacillus curdlanolyticus]EFM12872.1 conserved hypothetical protein [Paenibacillus curdlanolyticus YK9]
MAAEYANLVVWLIGLFGIVGIVLVNVARFVNKDSLAYDEAFVWRRRLPKEARPKRNG